MLAHVLNTADVLVEIILVHGAFWVLSQHGAVATRVTSIKTDLDSAISGIASTTSILDTLLLQMNQVRLAIPALLTAVGGINGALSCAW